MALLLLTGCGGPDAAERAAPTGDPPDTAVATTRADGDGRPARPVVLVLGNSLAAGYGVGPDAAFPALLQARIDSAGYDYEVVNAGVSGETTAGGLRRIDWLLQQPVAVLVLELGGNDALRGHDPDGTRENLQRIIDRTRARHPDADIVIAGMLAPPNLGPRYTGRFGAIYPELAEENDAALVPFLLDGVAADPALNQPDGIHPTAAGQRIVAENVWRVLEPILRGRRRSAR